MKVQNIVSYDITCMVAGKHYYFSIGEVKDVPEAFRGLHTAVLKEVIEPPKIVNVTMKKPDLIIPPEIKDKIVQVQKNATNSVELNQKAKDNVDDKSIFSPEIDKKIKSKSKPTKVKTTTKKMDKRTLRKGTKLKKPKISREKRLQIKKQLDKDKQSRR